VLSYELFKIRWYLTCCCILISRDFHTTVQLYISTSHLLLHIINILSDDVAAERGEFLCCSCYLAARLFYSMSLVFHFVALNTLIYCLLLSCYHRPHSRLQKKNLYESREVFMFDKKKIKLTLNTAYHIDLFTIDTTTATRLEKSRVFS